MARYFVISQVREQLSEPRPQTLRFLSQATRNAMMKAFIIASSLLLAATGALAGGPPQADQSATLSVTNQTSNFGDDTTGPTRPGAPVKSPDWI
jgi:hypothetical protein